MKLLLYDDNTVEVKLEGLVAVLTVWSKDKPTRSVKLNPSEISQLVDGLIEAERAITKRRTAGDRVF